MKFQTHYVRVIKNGISNVIIRQPAGKEFEVSKVIITIIGVICIIGLAKLAALAFAVL